MSAVVEIPPQIPPSPSWSQRLSQMDQGQRLRWGAVVALLVVGLIAAVFYSRQPNYKVLFAGLNDKDGGAIVAQLSQMNVPYQHAEGGGAILIPADRVHDVRLRLATQGLPKGTVAGFELTESSRFGITQFQERLNFQRGLEGELTRSIQALSSVQSARVHLALPNQNGFFREQQKPSASVLVSLHPGRVLDRAQIAGIVHLIASSVPELAPSAVSVLDDTGKLLSDSPNAGLANNGVDTQQLQYVQQIEQQYTRRIMDILEPVVGRNNVKAQVTAEVDFSRTESTSEQHRPNLSAETSAVRSQQVVESGGGAGTPPLPTGIPGATSNQPPQPSAAPINGANPAPVAAGQAAAAGAAAAAAAGKRESITNYEVDKTVQVTRGSTGTVKRLSAAVVVNYQNIAAEGGKSTVKPLTPEQLAQMTALVRETIGFSKDRGDSVNLMNTPFLVEAVPDGELPLWRQPEIIDLAKNVAWPLGASLCAALLLLGLLRPLVKSRVKARKLTEITETTRAGATIDALEAEDLMRPALPAPDADVIGSLVAPVDSAEMTRVKEARQLALENPMAVAGILKNWVNGAAS